MKKNISIIVILLPVYLFAQNNSASQLTEIVIDSTLSDNFFNTSHLSTVITAGRTLIQQQESGKIDTFYSRQTQKEIIKNCKIRDIEKNHGSFDNCISYFENDTLVIQIQNNDGNSSEDADWDKMLLHIVKNHFYAEYVYTSKSSYHLILKSQKLILKKSGYKSGERISGELSIQFTNELKISKTSPISFNGPFDSIVE